MTRGRPPLRAVILDFDGVVLESADIKTEAFGWVFRRRPAHLQRIVDYHRRNAGVSRFSKFEHIQRVILGSSYGPSERRRLGAAFARYVRRKVMAAPLVPGALGFLKTYHGKVKLFVVSGTPARELREIVRGRGLRSYFTSVIGTPPEKTAALGRLLRRHRLRPAEALYVGDAVGDWRAAAHCRVPFVARIPARRRSVFPKGTPRASDLRGVGRWIERFRSISLNEEAQ
ncbi:MAG: HAD family hydrolase [Elusimicrobia bacterium]|nr:HAD family hydrolase [Elusimicrobiota bacterium]